MAERAKWNVRTLSLSKLCEYINGPLDNTTLPVVEPPQKKRKYQTLKCDELSRWQSCAENELKQHMEADLLAVVMDYCKPAVAYCHLVHKVYVSPKGHLSPPLLSELSSLPIMQWGKAGLGDIVSVAYPNRDCALYIVDDVASKSLIKLNHRKCGKIDIPTLITDDLCDPIGFYQFSEPLQEILRIRYLCISFSHRCIRRVLGINAEAQKHFDHASENDWISCFQKQNLTLLLKFANGFDQICPSNGLQRFQLFEKYVQCVIGSNSSEIERKVSKECIVRLSKALDQALQKQSEERILLVLQILSHVRMDIMSLGMTGLGRKVNFIRRNTSIISHEIQEIAQSLILKWKIIVTAEKNARSRFNR